LVKIRTYFTENPGTDHKVSLSLKYHFVNYGHAAACGGQEKPVGSRAKNPSPKSFIFRPLTGIKNLKSYPLPLKFGIIKQPL
jgi:hypothetical protein